MTTRPAGWIIAFVLLPVIVLGQNIPGIPPGADPVPILLRNLESENVRVAAGAARSLGVVFAPGGRGGEEVETITRKLIEKLSSPKGPTLRRESAAALGNMQAGSALEPLKEAVKDTDYTVAVAAANAIRQILPVDDARVYLREIAADPAESIQVAAFDAMEEIAGAEDADFLIRGLDSANWRIQTSCIRGLGNAVRAGARPVPEVYDQVASLMSSEVANTAKAAQHFLSHIRNEECIRATIAAIDTRGNGGPNDTSWRTRTHAIRALRDMRWPRSQKGLPAVVRQLGDPTANVVYEARNLLNDLKEKRYINHNTLFPILLAELEAAEPDALRAGIMAEMGNKVPDQYASRLAAAATMSLEDAMKRESSWTVRAYSINLVGLCESTAAIEHIATCVGDDVPNVRQAAGNALTRLWSHCTDEQKAGVAPILQTYLEDTRDWRKTTIAARNAGYYPSKESVQPLVKLLSHGMVNVKDSASQSLINLVYHKDESYRVEVEKHVMPQLEATDLSWEYGAKVLAALARPEAVPLLKRILDRGSWRAQANAAQAVARVAERNAIEDKELNDLLIRNAQSDILQVQEASNNALRALAKLEPESK